MYWFFCAICGRLFCSTQSEEAALAEMRFYWGPYVTPDDCEEVCDACWQKMRPEDHLLEWAFAAGSQIGKGEQDVQ